MKDDDPNLKTYWRLYRLDEILSSNIAKQLNQNPATRLYDFEIGTNLDFKIGTNLTHGCWMVMADAECTRSLWDAWEAIAEVLLAMPMPPETSSAAS